MIVVWLFLKMPRVCLQFVTLVFPDYTHLLLLLLDPMIFYNQSNVNVVLRDHVEQCTVGETRYGWIAQWLQNIASFLCINHIVKISHEKRVSHFIKTNKEIKIKRQLNRNRIDYLCK